MTWYAFRTEPQKEFATQEIVNRRGLRAVVPHEWRFIRSSNARRKARSKIYPYLIGYIFIEFERPPNWYHMFSMRCLKSVVGFGGQPTPIPQDGIDRLMKLTGQSVPHLRSANTRLAFVTGDTVRVSDGALRGWEGRVEGVSGKHARMIFEMLGALREIDIPIETLEAA